MRNTTVKVLHSAGHGTLSIEENAGGNHIFSGWYHLKRGLQYSPIEKHHCFVVSFSSIAMKWHDHLPTTHQTAKNGRQCQCQTCPSSLSKSSTRLIEAISDYGGPGSAQSNSHRKSAISSHLLSTLLYVALMAHKLEDMRIVLEEEDGDIYDEWRPLLETLHFPGFQYRASDTK